jgi:hypothetical protein
MLGADPPVAKLADAQLTGAPLAGAQLTVTQVDGTQIRGTLLAWSAERLVLDSQGAALELSPAELLRVEWPPISPQAAPRTLTLVDGSRLPYTEFRVTGGHAALVTPLAPAPLTVPTRQIDFVQFAPELDWQPSQETQPEGDVLVLRKKAGGTQQLVGVLGEVTDQEVDFTWEGETIPVKRSKLVGLKYFHARPPQVKQALCWLQLQPEGRLPVASLQLSGNQVEVRTIGGLSLTVPIQQCVSADYSRDKLVYLSDLEPLEQSWTPRIGLPPSATLAQQYGLPRRDQSFAGSSLSLRWPSASGQATVQNYAKGLALRSRTVCRYRVPSGMQRLIAIAGIDPETAHQGHLTLEVFADQRSVWQQTIAGDAPPEPIDVDLQGARELRLVVDYGENLDFGDRLHLVEARVSK